MKSFFNNRLENSKSESESSLPERMKERQSYKSKSIVDDQKYKEFVHSNNAKNNTPEVSLMKRSEKSNGRSTSSFNISNVNTNYNNFNINLNNNFNPSFHFFSFFFFIFFIFFSFFSFFFHFFSFFSFFFHFFSIFFHFLSFFL